MTMHSYIIRAASEAELISSLEAAQAGKARPFIFETEEGKTVDPARITYPRNDGEGWFCEVRLDIADSELAALAPVSE
jgi:hypothetical protein